MAWGVWTQLPRWCVFRGSVLGHRASGCSCYGIFVSEKECQGMNLQDVTLVFQTQGVQADGVRMTPAMVPHVQTQLSRHNTSRHSCQGTMHLDAAVKAQRVQMQLWRHNASRRSCEGTTRPDAAVKVQCIWIQLSMHYVSGRSGRGTCLTDKECHGNRAHDAAHVLQMQRVKAIFFQLSKSKQMSGQYLQWRMTHR